MVSSIPARERFLKIPKADREAQDQFYLGDYLLASGNAADGKAALQQLLTKYPNSPYAQQARSLLEQKK